jgi:hypothetical protein
MEAEGVCALCHHNWPEENDLTLLCSHSQCKPREYHLFCLNSHLKSLPEVERDWFCPACHPYGTVMDLIQYFQWHDRSKVKNLASENFQCHRDFVGKTVQLHLPYPTRATHTGQDHHLIPSFPLEPHG